MFAQIDGGERRGELVGTARFDLDEAQHLIVESDEVDLARYLRAETISADRRLKVGEHDPVIVFEQKTRGELFAELTDLLRV